MTSGVTSVVLVLNCGSSSVKYALIDPTDGVHHVTGLAERVGQPELRIHLKDASGSRDLTPPADTTHRGVIERVLAELTEWLTEHGMSLTAVGHRVAHGGEVFDASSLIDAPALAEIRRLSELAPLHNPANAIGIEAASDLLPDLPHVAVFDTAFHHSMPAFAYRYAVPYEWYKTQGVRRYGFHGTSHSYVAGQAAALLGRPLESLRLVTAHLGNGCSLAAVRHGQAVDTSMGMTPLEGLVMGTRSGDLDPGVHGHLAAATGATIEQITADLNQRSGLLGLSRLSNDMREVHQAAAAGNDDAQLALEVFDYRLAKHVAAMMPALQGLDALVFTGGIGENSAATRANVVGLLSFLGWQLDPRANEETVGGRAGVITLPPSNPQVPVALVVPTDEELVIATEAARIARAGTAEGAGTAEDAGTDSPGGGRQLDGGMEGSILA